MEQIEIALITAYKNNYKDSENVKVVIDRQTGETHIFAVKEIVEKISSITNNKIRSSKNQ